MWELLPTPSEPKLTLPLFWADQARNSFRLFAGTAALTAITPLADASMLTSAKSLGS
ncbi:hypothetical protein D3C71_1712190 [compost metagenome]